MSLSQINSNMHIQCFKVAMAHVFLQTLINMNESILLYGFAGNYAHAHYKLYKARAKGMLVNTSCHVFEFFAPD